MGVLTFYFSLLKTFIIYLLCFRPTPQVDWEKIGGDLPKGRETKENYGKILKIENVSFQDKGNYRCTASNFLGSATHDFHVTVEGMCAPPPRGHALLRLPEMWVRACEACVETGKLFPLWTAEWALGIPFSH